MVDWPITQRVNRDNRITNRQLIKQSSFINPTTISQSSNRPIFQCSYVH
jgi:hypothetical protein